MRLADNPLAKGQRFQHPLRLQHCGAIVEHLMDVIPALGRCRLLPSLELQNLTHGGLGALNA